jgi:DNA replication and repair protein RecF
VSFSRLAGENFRLFSRFELEPQPGLNLVLGPNAAGKTTLLEAIYALGRGRSFRGSPPEVAGRAGPHWTVHGRVARPGAPESALGVAWSPAGLAVRIDQADAGVQELVRRVAVQVLEPDSHRLLEDGPVYRRRYLDWGVFHVEHRFFPAWRRYQRALRQRNHALRSGAAREAIEAWNAELVAAGDEIQTHRAAHVAALQEPVGELIGALLGTLQWSLELSRGWPAGRSLAEALAEHYEQDCRQGMTVAGPHRAELKLKLAGRSAKHQVSRGQQKLLIAALLLAQARLVERHAGRPPVLLIDDFPAELGRPFQAAFVATLRRYPGQVFVTSIERTPALETLPENAPEISVFHVEHGAVSAALRV